MEMSLILMRKKTHPSILPAGSFFLERCLWDKGKCDRGAWVSHSAQVKFYLLPAQGLACSVLCLWTSMEPQPSHQLWTCGTSQTVLLGNIVCCLLVWIFLEKCSCWLSTMQPVLLPRFSFKVLLALAAISFWSSLVQSLWWFPCVRDHY